MGYLLIKFYGNIQPGQPAEGEPHKLIGIMRPVARDHTSSLHRNWPSSSSFDSPTPHHQRRRHDPPPPNGSSSTLFPLSPMTHAPPLYQTPSSHDASQSHLRHGSCASCRKASWPHATQARARCCKGCMAWCRAASVTAASCNRRPTQLHLARR